MLSECFGVRFMVSGWVGLNGFGVIFVRFLVFVWLMVLDGLVWCLWILMFVWWVYEGIQVGDALQILLCLFLWVL